MMATIYSLALIAITLISPFQLSFVTSASLYKLEDPVWELDIFNFDRITFGRKSAFIIEFYASWCGHCMRFAPHWVEFAKDVENWKSAIEVGVVNCADSDNVKLCSKYEVKTYPTIKLFGPNITESNKGQLYEGERDLILIRSAVVDLLDSQKNIPDTWPILKPLESSHISQFWKDLPSKVDTAYVVVEKPNAIEGREIILDLSVKPSLVVRRVLSTNKPLVTELLNEPLKKLTFLKLERNGNKHVFHEFEGDSDDIAIRDAIFRTVVGEPRVVQDKEVVTTRRPDKDEVEDPSAVFAADLENAVRYSLTQEVGVRGDISGEALAALRAFVLTLHQFFPGRPPVKSFLAKVNDWLTTRKGNFTGDRFLIALDQLKTDTAFLPPMHQFAGCRGSSSKYRGYPCSLWTLFHTLTVQGYERFGGSNEGLGQVLDPFEILPNIRLYVKHFFGCRGCSEHFLELSAKLREELKSRQDLVLWLWRGHNAVNRRLAGDATEDPRHPKRQFPSPKACPACRRPLAGAENSLDELPPDWDEEEALKYLRAFYAESSIQPTKARTSNDARQTDNMIAD